MAPFSLMTAGVSWLAKSFSVFSCTSTLARCTSALPAAYINPVRCLSVQAGGPPKRPANGYLRYIAQQRPAMIRNNPEMKPVDIIKMLAQRWRTMSPEEQWPFKEAYQRAREQFKVDLERYEAQLTPGQVQEQAQEKRQRRAKRNSIRKKRELNSLGKPKRPRSSFNIYMSEHFPEARGTTAQGKMKALFNDWKSLFSHEKQIYAQLAQDDKIRYNNEMKSWEAHMIEIGRSDLVREQALPDRMPRRSDQIAVAKTATKPRAKKAPAKSKKKATAAGKSTTTTQKTAGSSSGKTVSK